MIKIPLAFYLIDFECAKALKKIGEYDWGYDYCKSREDFLNEFEPY